MYAGCWARNKIYTINERASSEGCNVMRVEIPYGKV